MTWKSILLTPNVLGKDGISELSRQMARALPAPALILSLHDPSVPAEQSPMGVEVRGARGSRAVFLASVLNAARHAGAQTAVACSHVHLAPIAKVVTVLSGSMPPTIVLCGIEVWVPMRTLERWALSSSNLTAISQHTIDRFRAANPALASLDISVCHPGVHGNGAPVAISSSAALIVARMSASERYKGHDALLDIWPRVLELHPDAALVVAGGGDDRPRLEARARDLGVDRAVRFVGRVSDEALGALYDECRFLVMPSRDEGFGLVFLEAMRASRPCIGGAGSAAEIIQHGVTGFVVNPDSRIDLAAAVERLYSDSAACTRMGAAGRERFLSAFTDSHFRSRFAQTVARAASMP